MQCAHCSTPVPEDARFCQSCGSLVSDAEGQARASAAIDASGLQHMETLLREDTAGHFEIRGTLGRGGMAMVYLATETALGRKVAIKVLPPELTFGHGVERFKREAKTAAALDHPNIIPVYRVATGGKLFWYAMKFLEGRSLEDMLKERQRLPLGESITILEQVADALDYAHEHNVVHRDIKPANVMLDSRNRVVVTDFGIAKALTEGTLTASGSVIGTPFFMSPEQGMGKPVAGASDQYSVAVMAYRMLSGHVPFDGDSAIDILHKHCMMPPPPLDIIAHGLPSHVAWAVNKGLEKDAAKRFKTVTAFVAALKNATAEADLSTSPTVMSAPAYKPAAAASTARTGQSRPTPRGSMQRASTQLMDSAAVTGRPSGRGKWIGITTGVLVLGGAGAWFALRPAPDSRPPATRVAASALPAIDSQRTLPAPAPALPPAQSRPVQPASRPAERRPAVQRPDPARTAPAAAPKPAAATPARGALQILVAGGWYNISIDGVSKGESGRLQDSLAPGGHLIHLERAGYVTIDTTVSIVAGAATRLQVRLTPAQE